MSLFKHYLKQLQVNPTMQHREISVKTFDTIFFHGGYPTVRNGKLGSSWKVKEGKSMMHLVVAQQIYQDAKLLNEDFHYCPYFLKTTPYNIMLKSTSNINVISYLSCHFCYCISKVLLINIRLLEWWYDKLSF